MKILRSIGVILFSILPFSAISASAQTLTNIWTFTGGWDGATPTGLLQGSDGNFYGTTYDGGTSNLGTVFRISTNGNLTNLYSFSGTDGKYPSAGLVLGSDGNFYGTTYQGGHTNLSGSFGTGYGTVFRISPSGSFTNLHTFDDTFTGDNTNTDGANPITGLVQGSDGNFYGTTKDGGPSGNGIVFRISPSGTFTNLYSFSGSDGSRPSQLMQGSDGNFYGTTSDGGTNGWGSVFRISPTGSLTNLHSFSLAEGVQPGLALVPGSDGNFYGVTGSSGTNGGYGTVFKISPISPGFTLTYLHTFGLYGDGGGPSTTLVQGSDGNFYGATGLGGTNKINGFGLTGYGTLFCTSPTGTFTHLYSFHGPDGLEPASTIVQGSDGNFYGTTYYGGYTNLNSGNGFGTVFRICIPLSPPANQISGLQITGRDLAVSVPSVAGETYQLQFTTDPSSDNWSNVVGLYVSNSIGALVTVTNFGGVSAPQGFYRFDITP